MNRKFAINYIIDECLVFPGTKEENRKYFCTSNQNIYFYECIKEQLTDKQPEDDEVKIKMLLPLFMINAVDLMYKYLNSVGINADDVIEFAKKSEPSNPLFIEGIDKNFDTAFRLFIDSRYYIKDGQKVDMTKDWHRYKNSVCLPIAKAWCREHNIRYYESSFVHLFYRHQNHFVRETDKNDCFIITEYENCEKYVKI